jgi:hypothetical protein
LSFVVTDAQGKAEALEPYMGMMGHAMILRDDEAVFVHIHPTGTVSMAARETFALREPGDTVPGMVARRMQEDMHGMAGMNGMSMPMAVSGDTVQFPYAFPKPGHYRLWVQVKRAGRVLTGTYNVQVAPKPVS